jgi:hypothetical protein
MTTLHVVPSFRVEGLIVGLVIILTLSLVFSALFVVYGEVPGWGRSTVESEGLEVTLPASTPSTL